MGSSNKVSKQGLTVCSACENHVKVTCARMDCPFCGNSVGGSSARAGRASSAILTALLGACGTGFAPAPVYGAPPDLEPDAEEVQEDTAEEDTAEEDTAEADAEVDIPPAPPYGIPPDVAE